MSELDELLDQLLGRELRHGGTGVDGRAWADLTETGLNRVGIAEELDGSGGDRRDATTVVVRAAQAGLGVPLAEVLFPASHVAAIAGRAVGTGVVTVGVLAQGSVAPVADGFHLSGTVREVPWAGAADELWLVVPADPDTHVLVVLEHGEWTSAPGGNLAGEPRDGVAVDLVLNPGRTHHLRPGIDREVLALSALGRSCQLLGAARACLELAHTYVAERHQFGKPLAAHQVVRHEVTSMACEVAAMEAAVAHAVGTLPVLGRAPTAYACLAIAAAKVQCSRSATRVARVAHHLHGAIGITAEHPLHHVTTRLWAWRDEAGTDRFWSSRICELVHGEYGSDLWAALTVPVRNVTDERTSS